jgi:hypothetical protein
MTGEEVRGAEPSPHEHGAVKEPGSGVDGGQSCGECWAGVCSPLHRGAAAPSGPDPGVWGSRGVRLRSHQSLK